MHQPYQARQDVLVLPSEGGFRIYIFPKKSTVSSKKLMIKNTIPRTVWRRDFAVVRRTRGPFVRKVVEPITNPIGGSVAVAVKAVLLDGFAPLRPQG